MKCLSLAALLTVGRTMASACWSRRPCCRRRWVPCDGRTGLVEVLHACCICPGVWQARQARQPISMQQIAHAHAWAGSGGSGSRRWAAGRLPQANRRVHLTTVQLAHLTASPQPAPGRNELGMSVAGANLRDRLSKQYEQLLDNFANLLRAARLPDEAGEAGARSQVRAGRTPAPTRAAPGPGHACRRTHAAIGAAPLV